MDVDGVPLVSVVIAAFNAGEYLNATMHSVRNQTHRNCEFIVVVDGATDGTLDLARRHADDDDRVRVIDLGRNLGRSAARNRGMAEARGDWVTVTDADDLWAPGRLEALLDAAATFPDSSLITDDLITFAVVPGSRVILGHRDSTRSTWRLRAPHRIRLREWYIDGSCPMNPLVRRQFLEATGATYPEHMSCGEDLCFQLELAFSPLGSNPVRVARPLYYYRSGESIRAPNMAESRLLSHRRLLERTANPDLARYVRRATPGALYRCQRADRQLIAAGRAGPRDPAAEDVEVHASRLRGVGQLALGKAVKIVSDHADRALRPAVIADIEAQLA